MRHVHEVMGGSTTSKERYQLEELQRTAAPPRKSIRAAAPKISASRRVGHALASVAVAFVVATATTL